MSEKKLTDKQKLWLENYLATFNATEAARRAGYKHPNVVGPHNLTVDYLQERIKERLNAAAMSADEVLYRLAQMARGSLEFFMADDGQITPESIQAGIDAGHGYLIKKLHIRDTRHGQVISLELHDPQTALTLLAKYHRLFSEQIEHRWNADQMDAAKGELLRKLENLFKNMREHERFIQNGHLPDEGERS